MRLPPFFRRAVLWDLDGTLVDSEEYHWLAWQEILGREGVPVTREQFLSTFGQRNATFLGEWLGSGATPARIARIGDAKEARYRELIVAGGVKPLPGAERWVARLRQSGWLQAIASSAPRRNVEVMLGALGFDSFFDAIVASEDVAHGKPDPEVFLLASARLAVPPESCVVVEDAEPGIEAARRAGMACIYVRAGKAPAAADLAAATLEELPPDAFERLLAR